MNIDINNIHSHIDKTAQDVVQLLCERKIVLTTAESCTGGLVSGAITSVSGSSQIFGLGICAYANEIKTHILGVSPLTLEIFGAVSAQCAREMALGAKCRGEHCSPATVAISVTGIAGPDGGSTEKPVGTVYFACAYKDNINTLHLRINSNDRQHIRLESVRQALILILNTIKM